MRCKARVQNRALEIRSGGDRTRRCWRPAHFPDGYCYQHSDHHRILKRILAIPPRST